jgi:excisionase family DNA binding protein
MDALERKGGSNMEKQLLRPVEAANLLGLGRSKTYELMKSGEIPSIRIGKSVRVPAKALSEWIDSKVKNGRIPPRA